MTIDEAIKLIQETPYICTDIHSWEFKDALKLGIEALKAIKDWRGKSIINQLILLPGETEE